MIRSRVDLPPPLGPEQGGQLSRRQVDADVVERDEVTELLGDATDFDAHCFFILRAEERDDHQARHRDQGEQGGHGVGGPLLEVLVGVLDLLGGRHGLAGDVARDDLDRTELADGPGQGEHHAVDDGPLDAGERDPAEGLAPVRPEALRRLLLVVADLLEHRHHLADDERQRDEDGGHDHARRGEDDLEAGVLQRGAEPAVPAVVDQHEREADDDRRDREGYVEQRAEDPLAREVVAHQQDRDRQAEDQVDEDREEGDVEVRYSAWTTSGSRSESMTAPSPGSRARWKTSIRRPGDQHDDVPDGDHAQGPAHAGRLTGVTGAHRGLAPSRRRRGLGRLRGSWVQGVSRHGGPASSG